VPLLRRTAQIDYRDFETFKVPVLMTSRTLIFRWPISRLSRDLCHVSLANRTVQIPSGFLPCCSRKLNLCATLADPTTVDDLIQDLTASINPLCALLLQRLISTQLFPIQRLTGFLCEIRRLSVSFFCRLLLSSCWM
jgi:hypothetical protein